MRITRIGGPTHLVELDGWRVLIDPTFDAPGRRYAFGFGTSSVKTLAPAVAREDLGPVDLVLLSHDHHADNLDDAGRALLPAARHVITTASAARRLALANTRGLVAGTATHLVAEGKASLDVTATPCRHGPPLSHGVVGDVVGFAVRREGESQVALWVTGDSVLYPAIRKVARSLTVDVAIVNAGGVRFGITGPLRYTMTGAEAVELISELDPRIAVPAHFSGWSHFRDGEDGMRTAVRDAPRTIRERIRWLTEGVPTNV